MRYLLSGVVAVFALVGSTLADPPQATVSQIMLKAHQPERAARKALDQKVIDGKATAEEKKQLLELYEALARAKPPAGKLEDWKKDVAPLVDAARKAARNEDGANEKLAQAVNCKACHVKYRDPARR